MTIVAALQTGPGTLSEALMSASAGYAATGTGSSAAAGTAGTGSAVNAIAFGVDSKLGNFQSSLNNVMESLRSSADKAIEASETIPLQSSLTAGQQRIGKPAIGAGAVLAKQPEPAWVLAAAQKGVELGGDSTIVKTAGAHQLEPADRAERAHRKQILFEADAKTGPASSGNNPEMQAPGVSTFISTQAEWETMERGEQGREGFAVSPEMEQCCAFSQIRTKDKVVPPSPLQPNSLNRDVASTSMETTPDEMDPMVVRPEVPIAALVGGEKQVEASLGRDLSEPTAGATTAQAPEPRLRDSPREPVSVSNGSAEAQALSSEHLSLRRGALKDASLQDANGRATRNVTHVDAPGEFINERKSTGLAAPQEMDLARLREVVAVNSPAEQQAGSTGSAPPPRGDSTRLATNDTFVALDADRTLSSVSWVRTGVHHAEAGYLDPALGWVGIRADASGSGIRAALVPGSMEAAQTLGGHLPGLNAYLAEHHEPVASVTLASPHNGSDGAVLDSRTGAGGGSAGHHQAGRGSEAQDILTTESDQQRIAPAVAAVPGAMESYGHVAGGAGTYVSVMA